MNPPPPPAASLKNGDAPAHQPSSSSAAKKNDDNIMFAAVQNENVPNSNARVTDSQGGATTSVYSKLTKKQLQELCQQRGLPKYGKNKAQIIARLVAGKQQAKSQSATATASRNKATKKSSSKVLSSKKKQSSESSSSGLTCAEFMGAAMYAALMAHIFSSFPAEDQAWIRGGGGGSTGSGRRPS